VLLSLVAILILFTILWGVSVSLRNSSIVDIWWGPGILLIGLIYYFTSDGYPLRAQLTLALLAIWAIRLAAHVGARNIGNGEDYRYEKMREEREDTWWWYSYVTVFLPHALIAWVVSLPLYFAIVSLVPAQLNTFDSLGVMLIVIGLFFEIVSDEHLRRFRSVPGSDTRVLDTGLWRYSRHPNYFGEAIVWWGFGMIGVATGGVPGLIGPAIMTFLLVRVTGVPLLESAMVETKPGYADYAARTSVFIPMPPVPRTATPPAPAVPQPRRPKASDRLRRK